MMVKVMAVTKQQQHKRISKREEEKWKKINGNRD